MLRSVLTAVLVSAAMGYGQVSVTTARDDNLLTAANLRPDDFEYQQRESGHVRQTVFAQCGQCVKIYAHPLIVSNVTIPGKGKHNVVYVASGNNTVCTFLSADDPAQSTPLWSRNLGPSVYTGGGDASRIGAS